MGCWGGRATEWAGLIKGQACPEAGSQRHPLTRPFRSRPRPAARAGCASSPASACSAVPRRGACSVTRPQRRSRRACGARSLTLTACVPTRRRRRPRCAPPLVAAMGPRRASAPAGRPTARGRALPWCRCWGITCPWWCSEPAGRVPASTPSRIGRGRCGTRQRPAAAQPAGALRLSLSGWRCGQPTLSWLAACVILPEHMP